MKKLFYFVLILFVGVTNYAFMHHMVYEKHDIDYHIVKDKAEVHDHCTVCKVAEQNTTYLDSDYFAINENYNISYDSNTIIAFSITLLSPNLRGPPQQF